jgi:vacuolar protein sorting-associated protein VTA1
MLIATLDKAEAAKKALNMDKLVSQDQCEAFAVRVFSNTDAIDRNGDADASTASNFYVSSMFLDVCAQFYDGELPPDLEEKSKYAKYRAVQIRDCVKKGMPITPPEPLVSSEASDLPGVAPPVQPPIQASAPSAPATSPGPSVPAAMPSAQALAGGGGSAPQQAKADAKKKAEFAKSCLEFGDVPGAKKFLEEALVLLQNYDD